MALTRQRIAHHAARLLVITVWIVGCASPTAVSPTSIAQTTSTSTPAPLPTTAIPPTPTGTPTPVPTLALPVRYQADFPQPIEPLGASADQTVVELARWGNGSLNQLALAPDGHTLVAATTAGLTLYDVPALRQRATYPAPSSVRFVAFAPDSTRLFAALDGSIQIVQASDGAVLESYETGMTLTDGDRPFAMAPDGATWAALNANGVVIRKLSDGSPVRELSLPTDPQARRSGLRYLPDGNLAVFSTGYNAFIRTLDVTTGRITNVVQASYLADWAFADHYAAYLEGEDGARLIVVDLVSGQVLGQVPQPERIYQLRFAPDGRTLAAAAADKICSWALPAFTSLGCLSTPSDYRSAPFSSQSTLLVPSNDRLTLRLIDPETRSTLGGLSDSTGTNPQRFDEVLLADQGRVYVRTSGRQIECWDETRATLLGSVAGFADPRDFRTVTVLSQDQTLLPVAPQPHDLLLLGNLYQTALTLDLLTGAETDIRGHVFVNLMSLSADGATGAYLSGRDLIVMNSGQARTLVSMPSSTNFTQLALAPDGQILAAAYSWKGQNAIHVWDVRRGVEIGQVPFEGATYEHRVAAMSFAPDSRTLAIVFEYAQDERLQVYDLSDPSAPNKVFGADTQTAGYVRTLAYTPDGAHLVLGREDGTLLFVSTADYRTPGLQVDTGISPGALGFLDDGRILAIAGDDNLAHLWGVKAESPLAIAAVTATSAPTTDFAWPVTLAGTPYPTPERALNAAPAAEWVALARWGEGETRGLAVAPNNRLAALSTSVGLTLYALPSLAPVQRIETGFPTRRALFSPDGAFVAAEIVGVGEERMEVWSTETGAVVYASEPLPQQFDTSAQQTLPFDFSADSQSLVFLTGTDIRFLDLSRKTITRKVALQLGLRPSGLRFTHHGTSLVLIGSGDATPAGLSWIDVATGAFLPVTPIPDNPIVAFDPSDAVTAVVFQVEGTTKSQIMMLDAATGAASPVALTLKRRVTALAFAPDGARLASLTEDGELCLWDPIAGSQLACRADAAPGGLAQIRFTPDGAAVVVGNAERVLAWATFDLAALSDMPRSVTTLQSFETVGEPEGILVRTQSGLTLVQLEPQRERQLTAGGDVNSLVLAADGASMVLAGTWGIEQVQIDTGAVIWSAPEGAAALELSSDGHLLAAGRSDGRVALYALRNTGREPLLLAGLSQPATGLALLQGDSILIAWNAEEARLWSTADGRALPAPQPAARALVAVLDGATAGLPGQWVGLDRELGTGIWAVDTGQQAGANTVLKGVVPGVQSAVIQADGIVLLNSTGLVKLDNSGRSAWTYPLTLPATSAIVGSRSSGVLAVASADAVTVLSGAGVRLGRIPGGVGALALNADGTDVVVARGREVEVWSRHVRSADGYAYTAYSYTPYGLNYVSNLQTVQADLPAGPAVIWSNGAANTALDPANGTVLGVLGTPGQRRLDSADLQTRIDYTGEGHLSVERSGTRTELLTGGGTYVYDLALSADGARLAAVLGGGTNATLAIWATNSATPIATIAISGVRFEHVALSASGSLLAATTGVNGDVLLYDLRQPARPTRVTAIAQRGVTALAFSPDEAQLALGDLRGYVTLIDPADPTRSFGSFRAHGSMIQALLYFPEAPILATTSQDGTLRLWGRGSEQR